YFGSGGGSSNWGEKTKGDTFSVYEGLLLNTNRYMELLYQAVDLLLQQPDLFPAAAATAAAADSELEMLLGGDAAPEERQKAAEAARRFDPWKRIRARDMAARGVPAHLRYSL
ncbi:hypothetical protein, conserved, partial [Eimeria maxima]